MGKTLIGLLALGAVAAANAAPPRLPRMKAEELANYLPDGGQLETRLDADVNGDGLIDVIAVGRSEDKRTVRVMLGYITQTDLGYRPVGEGQMEIDPLGSAELQVQRGVLIVKDLTGGTSALSSTYRYRYDPAQDRMRLIGDDVTFYSRTNSHGSLDVSTNRLTGLRIETRSEVNKRGGDAALIPAKPVKKQVSRRPIYMEQAPLPSETTGIG